MRAVACAVIVMAAANGCQPEEVDWPTRLGRFALASDGTPCVGAVRGALEGADSVWVVEGLPGSQAIRRAAVDKARQCPEFGTDDEEAFPVVFPPSPSEVPFLGVAVWGTEAGMTVAEGVAQSDVDGDGVPELFGLCTSYEGVHLTVWSGAIGVGVRRWHKYHPLFYDVEPSCTEAEMAAPYS